MTINNLQEIAAVLGLHIYEYVPRNWYTFEKQTLRVQTRDERILFEVDSESHGQVHAFLLGWIACSNQHNKADR